MEIYLIKIKIVMLTDLENELMVSRGEGWEGRDRLGVSNCMYALLYLK